MEINKATSIVEEVLDSKRFEHTIRVANTAEMLSNSYGVSVKKAKLAAILHDFAKNHHPDELKRWIITSDIPKDLLDYHHELWHGPVGALMLEKKYGLNDRDILGAISCHTTGKAHMSKLEKIVYLADYIEPGRNFPGVAEVREVAEENLLHACWMVSRNTIQFLSEKRETIYPDSLHAYNDLTHKMNLEGFIVDGE